MWRFLFVTLELIVLTIGADLGCTDDFLAQHGAVFPLPGSCGKFLVCVAHHIEELNCPKGYHFDVETLVCRNAEEVKCSQEGFAADDELCNNPDEITTHPDPHNCAKYTLCLGNTAIPQECSTGLLFNSLTGQCDIAQNVFCNLTCPAVDTSIVYLPDSSREDCARYYLCLQGIPRPRECSKFLYFDMVSGSCKMAREASCRIPDVTCSEQSELIENPKSCTSYYECSDGFPHFMQCGLDEHFSEGKCVPGPCDSTTEGTSTTTAATTTTLEPTTTTTISTTISTPIPTTTTIEPTTTSTTIEPTTISTTLEPTTTTLESTNTTVESTTTTIESVSTTTVEPITTSTTVESTSTTTVVEPITTSTTVTVPTTTTTSTITTSTTTPSTTLPPIDAADVCRDVDIGIVPHPNNCYQYFVCLFGSGKEATCHDSEIFNAQLLACVVGDRSTCK